MSAKNKTWGGGVRSRDRELGLAGPIGLTRVDRNRVRAGGTCKCVILLRNTS